MDLSAIRKLSMTLKPLIEITEVLEKVENAEQQLGSIKGSMVAAKREYDAMIERTSKAKADADKQVADKIAKANKDAETILQKAKIEAEASTKSATENAVARLSELTHKMEKAETEYKTLDEIRKKTKAEVATMEARLKQAENSLAELRAAHAAVRI